MCETCRPCKSYKAHWAVIEGAIIMLYPRVTFNCVPHPL